MKRVLLLSAGLLAVIALLLILMPDRQSPREPSAHPNEWFWVQRAWPQGNLNMDAYRAAAEQARRMRADAGREGLVWEAAGPSNIGARVTDLAVDPIHSGILYAAMASGGIFRSEDAGAHWTPLFDEEAALSIGSVAVDPGDPSTIWVGTGEANAGSYSFFGMGMFKSVDGGASWQYKGLEETRYIARVVVNPSDSDRVYAACTGELFGPNPERGVYRSLDAGDNWQRVLSVTDSTAATAGPN